MSADEFPKLYLGDCVPVLRDWIADESVDLTVTSPPYDNLRAYSGDLSWDFEKFCLVANQLYRVTKQGGVVVWIVGDETIGGSETLTSFRQAIYFQSLGFNVETMIYEKSAWLAFPNRYNQAFEYMFVFSKGNLKTFHPIQDRKNLFAGRRDAESRRQPDGSKSLKKEYVQKSHGTRSNIWRYPNGYNLTSKDKITFAHPAPFPENLARDHILSWSDEGDVVLDPFVGSGTTVKMAHLVGRKGIGIEIHEPYLQIARERVSVVKAQPMLGLEVPNASETEYQNMRLDEWMASH